MGATNCPETPRQKMIAMMYLVLTALLALNVSREIIEAFVMVEGSLSSSVENFDDKNKSIYASFSEAEMQNEAKVKPWRLKADNVKNKASNISDFIQDLKIEIVTKADGSDAIAIHGRTLYSDSIVKNDDLNYGGEVMIGANNNKAAYALHDSIDSYREFLKGMVDASQIALLTSFEKTLDTSDPPGKVGDPDKKTWETLRFDNLPLIAVITMLSKLQTDISNTESDMINYLYKQIDAKDVKVNKIDAIVKSKSNYIFKGGKYHAEIFLAAFDTTQKPIIYVGKVDSVENEDGSWSYMMNGQLGVDYDTIPVINGVGRYERTAGALSPSIKWGGLIEIPVPGGSVESFPFKADYQVAEAGLVVSPTKMNVFYIGVDNPVDISVPGVPKENIKASMTNGSIIVDRKSGGWIVRPIKGDLNGKRTKISVVAEVDGRKKEMGSVVFRVKTVPDPVAKVGDKKGGKMPKTVLLAQRGVFAEIENFDFKMPFKVTSFDVTANIKGYEVVETTKGNRFSAAQKDLIRKLRRGNRVTFENIKAKGEDKILRNLSPLIFKLR